MAEKKQSTSGHPEHDDAYGETRDEERETIRGEQGTSSGDPHDDTDPQQGR